MVCISWTLIKINNYCTVLSHVRKYGESQIVKYRQILIPELIYQELSK